MAKKQSQTHSSNIKDKKNKKHEISKKKNKKEKKEKKVKIPLSLDEMPHMHPLGNSTYSFHNIVEQLFTQYTNLLFPHVDEEKK